MTELNGYNISVSGKVWFDKSKIFVEYKKGSPFRVWHAYGESYPVVNGIKYETWHETSSGSRHWVMNVS